MRKLLYFGAKDCYACKALWPTVEKEAPKQGYDVEYLDMDDEDDAVIADEYKVKGLPTIVIIENGKVTKRAVGNTAWKEVQ